MGRKTGTNAEKMETYNGTSAQKMETTYIAKELDDSSRPLLFYTSVSNTSYL